MDPNASKLVLYVGPFSFPSGGAAARRILGNCQALQQAGFKVAVASGQPGTSENFSEYKGIKVLSLDERNAEHLPRWLKRLAYFRMGSKTLEWLDSLPERPYAVILYSGYSPYLLRLIPWAKRNSVRLIFDAVEWYEPDSLFAYLSPYQLNIELAMRFLTPRVKNTIAISSFLHDYYLKGGGHSLRTPPLLDVLETEWSAQEKDRLATMQLVYAGSPGKKDLLDRMLCAVLEAKQEGLNLKLSIAGVDPDHAGLYPSIKIFPPELVASTVKFLGVLSHDESMHLVRGADYSLLLRNVARYSRAGFPTKFVESFSVGTPVIANITSDLGEHLIDGATGWICEKPSPQSLKATLFRAAKINREKHTQMRQACRDQALRAFDYRNAASSLTQFLETARTL
ncbi:glycosyltransferase involved in cell wall biosynthesis [Variovorax boronicumulans]|uniref:Glycosyltransferase involved in cell wall biosynthesis n=1 Tax=Variovorax boronicumulans TaxID=436515 RepID=A0AAW8CUR9_9BURK|nr:MULTISPECIES: glycosyltransferase [Variovorax]MDP9894174.1 glycosyltransferase involved in cell wall biosynthesis [Variovorax boronicumulans]MDQ0053993.1 glycosyltransferase involved in cell wall biosynthesis [Variovorax boronicumulans]MDQ0606600.1 glycosyltransferase involved in cell wall biosynthesis [Variovorax sp. W1I1]